MNRAQPDPHVADDVDVDDVKALEAALVDAGGRRVGNSDIEGPNPA